MNEQLLKTSGADVLSSGKKKKTQKNLLGGIHPTPPPPTPPPLYVRGLRRMQSSKQGMWKEYYLSREDIRKGFCFHEKWYIKG